MVKSGSRPLRTKVSHLAYSEWVEVTENTLLGSADQHDSSAVGLSISADGGSVPEDLKIMESER